MAKVVISGDTSGAVTLEAPAVAGTTTLTLPTTSGTIVTTAEASALTTSGNLTFTGTGNRITGDFSNATTANRVLFQTSTTNGNTAISAIPNGTAVFAGYLVHNSATDLANASSFGHQITSVEAQLSSSRAGTGSFLPMTFYTGGSERLRIDTSGNVGIGTTSPSYRLEVASGDTTAGIGYGFRVRGNSTANAGAIQWTDNGATAQWGYLAVDSSFNMKFGGASSERMRIDSSGRVTMPYQPAFDATGSGTQSWSGSAAYQVLQMSVSNTNIPSNRRTNYNTSTYRFTAPVTGAYFFYCSYTITAASTGPEAIFSINNRAIARMVAIGYMYSGGYFTANGNAVIYLNASDYVDVQIINNNNTSFTVDLGRSFFGGYLLG